MKYTGPTKVALSRAARSIETVAQKEYDFSIEIGRT